ncbi:hypothetical protein TNCV_540161 [Trichonephila clavipes]|nr:hypothetical protein TNCV_540161 [Trichonephila clavipes]
MERLRAVTSQRCSAGSSMQRQQYKRGAAVKYNTTSNYDTGCGTSGVKLKANVQHYPNSNPTLELLETKSEYVSNYNVVPFHCQCPRSSYHWQCKRRWFLVKVKRSNRRLADCYNLLQLPSKSTSGHRVMQEQT